MLSQRFEAAAAAVGAVHTRAETPSIHAHANTHLHPPMRLVCVVPSLQFVAALNDAVGNGRQPESMVAPIRAWLVVRKDPVPTPSPSPLPLPHPPAGRSSNVLRRHYSNAIVVPTMRRSPACAS